MLSQQAVFNTVHERLPAGVDDVVAHAHGAPAAGAVGGFEVDAGLGIRG